MIQVNYPEMSKNKKSKMSESTYILSDFLLLLFAILQDAKILRFYNFSISKFSRNKI